MWTALLRTCQSFYRTRPALVTLLALATFIGVITFGSRVPVGWQPTGQTTSTPPPVESAQSAPSAGETELANEPTAPESDAADTTAILSAATPDPVPVPDAPPPVPVYVPPNEVAKAHPSNYGDRVDVDARGQPLDNEMIAVLHETGWTADSAINAFKAHNTSDSAQVSYHDLIRRDGTIVHIVPLEKRAYGAGNSEFRAADGTVETAITNPDLPSSVNNFSYHVSLESPPGVSWYAPSHSGYTDEQYRTLAWAIAQVGIPDDRIVTHKEVDRAGARSDPRAFNFDKLYSYLDDYRGTP